VSEVHLFVVWSEARTAEARILEDVAARFRLLDLVEVTWSRAAFSQSLVRFYGSALPPGSDKERHCGTGPFVVAVVEDRRPRYRPRRTGRGWALVNASVIDARTRYREWTGGGYRVHASETAAEAERDLVLLFGRRGADFLASDAAPREALPHDADLVGTHGWSDPAELLLALEVTSGASELPPRDGADLALSVTDLWWAEQIAGGRDLGGGTRELKVAGRTLRVAFVETPARRTSGLRALVGRGR
jgi:hypothetical protein